MASLFEPLRKSFYDGPSPPPMQFLMPEKALSADAEVGVLLGLHQTIGGPFKLVYLFRRLRCVHVFECTTQGREWYYSLHLTSDNRYALRDMQPSAHNRDHQYPDWWIRGAGVPYPSGVRDYLTNDLTGVSENPSTSVLVVREASHHLNLSGGKELLVPSRFLYGALPQALLDAYRFWEDESEAPEGTRAADVAAACSDSWAIPWKRRGSTYS
ncbi:hypothetical protein B484DRAFT_102886 [Ochromonadaceae sp. CCMP2298]|nr:hypothetical protein B484DRAFT_102886 [Ochromonadaceae sp. CCMP2298]